MLSEDFEIIRNKLNAWSQTAFEVVATHARQESASGDTVITFGAGSDKSAVRKAYNAAQTRTRGDAMDKRLRETAQLYRDNVNDGVWRLISDRFGVSESTAGRYVRLARKAGYLPPTGPGKKKA